MKMVKSLLLGGAAGLVAVAGAQAAALPVKAKPVEYGKNCSLFGAGFFYIPGTDPCLKIGGWVRYDQYFGNTGGSGVPFIAGAAGRNESFDSADYGTRARTVVSFDARTQTEYGTLRSYARFGFDLTFNQQNTGGLYTERACSSSSRASPSARRSRTSTPGRRLGPTPTRSLAPVPTRRRAAVTWLPTRRPWATASRGRSRRKTRPRVVARCGMPAPTVWRSGPSRARTPGASSPLPTAARRAQ